MRRTTWLIAGSLLFPLSCGDNDDPTGPVYEALLVSTTSLPNAVLGFAYSETLTATGGDGNYTWSVTVGSLPTGLTLTTSTGELTGAPSTIGSNTFTVQVASGDGQTDTQQLTITVETPPVQPPPNNALVLSEPVASTGVSPASSVPMVPRSISSGPVVFLSLGPGTASEGTTATVQNVTTGLQVDALLGGGGLDPIPLAASIGDSLVVTVPLSTGAPLEFGSPVPASRPPTVMRTIPANNATGVPRNRAIVVVFSEPMAPASVNATTIQLQHNGAAVAGAVAFLDSSHVTVIFTPAALLEADMQYRLVVGDGVTDLDGDHLEAPAAVEFTTGQSLLGPVADVAVYPSNTTVPSDRMLQYTALLTDAAGDTLVGLPVSWSTGDDAIATLSDFGVNMGIIVLGAAAGTTTITATSGGVSGSADVTVLGAIPTLAFSDLSAGYDHTCALTTDGSAYCWGGNNYGQLGTGSTTRTPYPTAVSGGLTFASVGAGLLRSYAMTEAGEPWCWGDSGVTNIIGLANRSLVPFPVAGGPAFTTMVVGGVHACGLTADGLAYCWGANSWGQLGDPTTGGSNTPRAVSGELVFMELAAGGAHTCGLTTDSLAYCWGYNSYGGLGNGTTSASFVPSPVSGGMHFAALGAGNGHTCGITATGALYCWGANGRGQLGATSAEICPGQADAVATDDCSLTPLLVAGISAVETVGAGYTHTCALTTEGLAYCWGENTYAQLGTDTRTDSPTPVAVSGGLVFAKLSSAYYHSCGITTDGIAYCWGMGVHGELGDGTTEDRTAPVRVAGQ
jgi:alpha-tubulin suppressor-like RCC1 family protein